MVTNLGRTISIEGKSGKKYTFYLYSFTQFSDLVNCFSGSGIYVFLNERDESYGLIYCGKTGDFSIRFDNHHAKDCIDRNNADHIAILYENDAQRRTEIEADILANYEFACNVQLQ